MGNEEQVKERRMGKLEERKKERDKGEVKDGDDYFSFI